MSATPWSGQYRRISLGIIALVSIFGFEGIAIGSIMPVAVRDLHALSDYSSVFTTFTMASLLGMALAGLYADRIGFDRAVLGTIVFMACGSVLAGTAHALPQLLAGRVFQGLGLGTDLVTMYVLVARAYPEELRPRTVPAASRWGFGDLPDPHPWRDDAPAPGRLLSPARSARSVGSPGLL